MNHFHELLNEYAEDGGLDAARLVATSDVVIDGVTISLMPDGDPDVGDVIFYAELAPRPESVHPVTLRAVLEANMLWAGTGGCTLGLHPEAECITVCLRIALRDLDASTLAAMLEHFAEIVKTWDGHLADLAASLRTPIDDADLDPAPSSRHQFLIA